MTHGSGATSRRRSRGVARTHGSANHGTRVTARASGTAFQHTITARSAGGRSQSHQTRQSASATGAVNGSGFVQSATRSSLRGHSQPFNQAMQLTASKPAVYASDVGNREHMQRGMHRGLAAAVDGIARLPHRSGCAPCHGLAVRSIDSSLCSSPSGLRLRHGLAVRSVLVSR